MWSGNKHFEGLDSFFAQLESKAYKIQNRSCYLAIVVKLNAMFVKANALREEASYVKIANKTIMDLVDLPIDELSVFFKDLKLGEHDTKIAKRLLKEINTRLQFLSNVGLNYLTLNRKSNTLSGGESQRINLATSLVVVLLVLCIFWTNLVLDFTQKIPKD